MPVHDWTRVDAGIFHAFHHSWIEEIARALNRGILPEEYYALSEQHAAGFGPDVLTLQGQDQIEEDLATPPPSGGQTGSLVAASKLIPTAETDLEYYRRKQASVAVRHVSGDRVVATVEIVSPGNKSTRHAIWSFVEKAAEFLDRHVHLLIVDVFPPGSRDPQGVHALIWDEVARQEYVRPSDRPLTSVAYETAATVRAYVETFAVGDSTPDMPLFLKPNGCVPVPLETTYQAAFDVVPRRWRRVLEEGT